MLTNAINTLNEVKDAITQASCGEGEPFIKLGSGAAPVLNYSIPQTTCFSTYGYMRKYFPAEWFKPVALRVPENNYFTRMEKLTAEQVKHNVTPTRLSFRPGDRVWGKMQYEPAPQMNMPTNGGMSLSTSGYQFGTFEPQQQVYAQAADSVAIFNEGVTNVVTNVIKNGSLPIFIRPTGRLVPRMAVLPKPPAPKPYFVVIEEYRTCSYLGDYGAGRTVRTFSLLPGERTTISVRTYKDRTSTKQFSQNVIDSYSETSASELEKLMGEEKGIITGSSSSSYGESSSSNWSESSSWGQETVNSTEQDGWGFNGSMSINAGIFGFNFGGGKNHSSSETTSSTSGFSMGQGSGNSSTDGYSSTGMRQDNVNTIARSMDKHVNISNAYRQVDVNTSTVDSVTEGYEEVTVRELVNYNKSRVLNFVFRQLLQEYITVTYLASIRIGFCNGYPETIRVVNLENLENMLIDLVQPANIDDVRRTLLRPYCAVLNYQDEVKQFVEERTIDYGDCLGDTSDVETMWRVKKDLADTFEEGAVKVTVKGVILNVGKQTLKTSSLVADSLLGQGEALDCYNQKLQDADSIAAYLGNMVTLQQIQAIEDITDPAERTAAYKKVFGQCCENAQTQIIA